MNRVRTKVSKETNYVYHMLSVARCGYDNDYGKKYCCYHKSEDLSVLKKQESYLTVCGGEHIGELYFEVIVGTPANGLCCAKDYYTDLVDVFSGKKNFSEYFDAMELVFKYSEYKENIVKIASVMRDNYDIYINLIWPEIKDPIIAYAQRVEIIFENSCFTERAEKMIGVKLDSDYFYATLCNSLSYGAEAIDISKEQDVFGIDRTEQDEFMFIGHEYLIYLLMKSLASTKAFSSLETWKLTEGLAEFYLELIIGTSGFFEQQRKYIDSYKKLHNRNPRLTAKELFEKVLDDEC